MGYLIKENRHFFINVMFALPEINDVVNFIMDCILTLVVSIHVSNLKNILTLEFV